MKTFYKLHILRCGGSEHGSCPFTIEAKRSDLPGALRTMASHAADQHHRLNNIKAQRASRIIEVTP
jgi:hypothetical protein